MTAHALTVFEGAIALPEDARPDYLERACRGLPALRAQVEAMLAVHASAMHPGDPLEPVLADGVVAGVAARATASRPLGLPDRIAGLRILGRLGQGSGGVVFRAEQEHLCRHVAVKVMHVSNATPELARRFLVEAQALSRLRHPGIAHMDGLRPAFASGFLHW